ncbi:TPA: hypothetical protein ACP32N_003251 [Pseudomonas aeruginosa]
MKKLILAIALSTFGSSMAFAASNIGQCVYPKNIVGADGSLKFKQPIVILSQPDENGNKSVLKTFSAFTIGAEANGYIQLVTVPDYDAADPDRAAGKIFGWAKLKDFDSVALRNCN